jgi:signal transduction histidine kinase
MSWPPAATSSPSLPESFASYVQERNVSGARLACVLVAVLMPAGVALDWFTHPAHVHDFLLLRFASSAVSLLFLVLTYAPAARRFAFLIGAAPAITCAAFIEVMVQSLEGYASPYYAGLNLCILGLGLVFTWRHHQTALVCLVVILIWLVPSLVSSQHIEIGPFFNNLYFLVLFSTIAVFSNATRYRLAQREHEARTQLARTSDDLAQALSRLRETDRLKNEFFANISHELRTPLTLILAPLGELLSRPDTPERDTLAVMQRNASRLLGLIDDLLDLARLDAGGLRLNVGPVDVAALCTQLIESFQPAARAKPLRLDFRIESVPTGMFGDPHRLEMVLNNLIGNALKFTPPGGAISVILDAPGNGARLRVADTGPGIPPEDLARIFERFYQVDRSASRRFGGAGIGLALARELTELHGGRLSVESKPGEGTTFTLWWPGGREHFRPEVVERRRASVDGHQRRRAEDHIAATPASKPDPDVSALPGPSEDSIPVVLDDGRRARVLLAEDQDDLRGFIARILSTDFDVLTAADGAEALAVARRERPDLVLSDVMMPGMSGTDLCRAIKSDPALGATPVILLTAKSGTDAALEGYGHGADDFVVKPFHSRLLMARVRAQLRLRALGLEVASQAKLAAVGVLAAGIVHEVRNPLNAMLNAARMLEKADVPAHLRKLVGVVIEAGNRMDRIVLALDEHARPADAAGGLGPVGPGLDATISLLEHRLGGVAIQRDYHSEAVPRVPIAEANQIFLNLIDNAVRAGAKHVWVETSDLAERVVVRIRDDGAGVPADIAARIFDPFFTTRAPGEGMGLGLYLSRRLARLHGGDIKLVTPPRGGAEFVVELPRT